LPEVHAFSIPLSRCANRLERALLGLAFAGAAASCSGGGASGGSTTTGMTYGGPTQWTIAGPQGGPFSNPSLDVVLGNPGALPIDWSAASIPSFVLLDATSGVIPSGSQTTVHATLNQSVALTLVPDIYLEGLVFHNDSTAQPDIRIDCTLAVLTPDSSSQLEPDADLATQGAAGGPFTIDDVHYTLANTGIPPLAWEAHVADPWVSVDPASGLLAPGETVDLTVSIVDPATGGLALGLHPSAFEIRDASSQEVQHTRQVDLNVLPGASGWTAFVPSADTRIVYVSSSSGDDGNSGLSEGAPVRTIAAGKALLRDGFPDWLLLKKGDSWNEALGTWGLSGRSLTERMLISSYGSSPGRPLLRTGTDNGFSAPDDTSNDHLAIVGLHLWADSYDGANGDPRGIQVYGNTHNLLIEDCHLQAYNTNLVVQGTPDGVRFHSNVVLRRNVIVDAYTTGTDNTAGLFASGIQGALIEENVLDHNGWRDDVPGSDPTWYRRNVYVQNGNTGVVFRRNIVAGTDGIQLRSGGLMEDNLFLHNAIAMQLGGGTEPEAQGITGTVRFNVVLDGRDLQVGNPRGWGLTMSNVASATVDSNVIAHNVSGTGPYPLVFDVANGWQGNTRGVEDTLFTKNVVYAWNGSSRFTGTAAQTVGLRLTGNKIQNGITPDPLFFHEQPDSTNGIDSEDNVFHSIAVPGAWMQIGGSYVSLTGWMALVGDTTSTAETYAFPDPLRTIETYSVSIGGLPSRAAFLREARRQSKSFWRDEYTAHAVDEYIRAGYGL